ncbi:MAG: vWA domain-containing protein [Gammaproteobacteria bacterium]
MIEKNIRRFVDKTRRINDKMMSGMLAALLPALLLLFAAPSHAEGYGFAAQGGYGLKIYRVNPALYPFVQVYIRTFDQNMQPLVNLNALNIGLMVKGKSYDVGKRQYGIQTIRQRSEATRSILILDASISMAGHPFEASLEAAGRFIDGKRPQDEVAVLAIRDTEQGYDLVSQFERDGAAIARRMADIRVDGQRTRLYDSIAAGMQMCAMSAQGSSINPSSDNVIASCSIVVFSDGRDEGSALSREELNGRITSLEIPVPVYSLAYSKTSEEYFKNLESISKNSFGVYYPVGKTVDKMQRVVEDIQNILQSDYVVTFRSYQEVDGEKHAFKVGVEYPSGSGKYTYDSDYFEAIEPPPVKSLLEAIDALESQMPLSPDGNPYFVRPAS